MFVALVAMSLVSIVGRKLFAWPVPGDVEMLQMCAAFASSAFFAWCHLVGGDVKVDFFTHGLRPSIVAGLDAFGSLLVGFFGACWPGARRRALSRCGRSGRPRLCSGWPVWLAQALMVPGFALLAAAGFYMCASALP